jgi:hypothetical protein
MVARVNSGVVLDECCGVHSVVQVLVNNIPRIIVRMNGLTISNCLTRSRSSIIALNAGDTLYVSLPSAACYYADSQNMQMFTGFRLF